MIPVGFLDDDTSKARTRIHGVPVLDRRVVAGRERDVIVVYEEEPEGVVLITFHPLRDSEKTHRLSGRRWIPA